MSKIKQADSYEEFRRNQFKEVQGNPSEFKTLLSSSIDLLNDVTNPTPKEQFVIRAVKTVQAEKKCSFSNWDLIDTWVSENKPKDTSDDYIVL